MATLMLKLQLFKNCREIKLSHRESIHGSKLILAYRYTKAHYKPKAIKVESENQYNLHAIGLNIYLILFTTCLLYCTCHVFWSKRLMFPLDILSLGRAPRIIERIHSRVWNHCLTSYSKQPWDQIQEWENTSETFAFFSFFFKLLTANWYIISLVWLHLSHSLFLVTEIIAKACAPFRAPFSHFISLDTIFPHFVFRYEMKHEEPFFPKECFL